MEVKGLLRTFPLATIGIHTNQMIAQMWFQKAAFTDKNSLNSYDSNNTIMMEIVGKTRTKKRKKNPRLRSVFKKKIMRDLCSKRQKKLMFRSLQKEKKQLKKRLKEDKRNFTKRNMRDKLFLNTKEQFNRRKLRIMTIQRVKVQSKIKLRSGCI